MPKAVSQAHFWQCFRGIGFQTEPNGVLASRWNCCIGHFSKCRLHPAKNLLVMASSLSLPASDLSSCGGSSIMHAIVELKNLRVEYKAPSASDGKKVAVKNLNLQVRAGEVFGFLGPNGAGKTTTMNVLLGFVNAT